mgnify:CR=1 FL=1
MKILKIILFILLTLSLIFFALQLDLATIFMAGFLDKTSQLILMTQLILQIGGFISYWKLLKRLQNKIIISPRKELFYWIIAFVTLMIIPGGIVLGGEISKRVHKRDQVKYEQEHCVEKITKTNGYKVKICENGTIAAESGDAAAEYFLENK